MSAPADRDDVPPLTDAEANAMLLSLRNRVLESMRTHADEVVAPRGEVLLAVELAAIYRHLLDAIGDGCDEFAIRGKTFRLVSGDPTKGASA